jgi:hypothetical protein
MREHSQSAIRHMSILKLGCLHPVACVRSIEIELR